MNLSKAQQKMIDRLKSGDDKIGYGRLWYAKHNNQWIFFGSKAHDATIEALIKKGVLIERGDKADYSVELTGKQ